MVTPDRDNGPLQEAIFSYISRSLLATPARVGKKDIHRHINSSYNGEWSKKDVKRAFKQLVKQGKIQKESKEYFVPRATINARIDAEEEESDASESNDDVSSHVQQEVLPIAQRMRHHQHSQKSIQSDDHAKLCTNNGNNRKESGQQIQVDLDEEIRRLEAELAADTASDEDLDDDDDNAEGMESDNDDHTDRKRISLDFQSKTNDLDSSGVICLSEVAHERIEPLPPSAMPQIARKTTTADPLKEHRKRKKCNKKEHIINEGLKHAVNDILSNYKTRSEVEQTPWYCRICQHQANNESEFISHRESAFHKTAVSEHKKKTYCRMCRKQMTSLVQFEEHMRSRPHRELLSMKRAQQQQQGRGGFDGKVGPGRGGGSGTYRRGGGRGSSRRQWC
ncbi:hypothetical protein HJC23_004373 [Cyclotella cryptica]|uniref:C2H2-type domain-containing protein n=1 Tax=Cyclotella cryptica TaxID=29204 RepID=A0ABD3PH39_9STRA